MSLDQFLFLPRSLRSSVLFFLCWTRNSKNSKTSLHEYYKSSTRLEMALYKGVFWVDWFRFKDVIMERNKGSFFLERYPPRPYNRYNKWAKLNYWSWSYTDWANLTYDLLKKEVDSWPGSQRKQINHILNLQDGENNIRQLYQHEAQIATCISL